MPRHMNNNIDRVTGEYPSKKDVKKFSDTQISYDPILGDDDDEMDKAAAPCDSESSNYNACKKNTDKTGKNTGQLTVKDSKRSNPFIIRDSYMHDGDEPNNNRPKGNKYARDYEGLIVTYSTYKRDGLRWRKDTKETYNVFRSIDKKNVILPADEALPDENLPADDDMARPDEDESSILSQNSKNYDNDNTIAVFQEPSTTRPGEYDTLTFDLSSRNLEYEKYLVKFLARLKEGELVIPKEHDNLDKELSRIFKKTNFVDFFRDPVASVVEVLEYVTSWIANVLSLPPPDPVDHDKLIYKREEKNLNFSIYVAALMIDNKLLVSYSRDLTNNSDGREAIGYMHMNQ